MLLFSLDTSVVKLSHDPYRLVPGSVPQVRPPATHVEPAQSLEKVKRFGFVPQGQSILLFTKQEREDGMSSRRLAEKRVGVAMWAGLHCLDSETAQLLLRPF